MEQLTENEMNMVCGGTGIIFFGWVIVRDEKTGEWVIRKTND